MEEAHMVRTALFTAGIITVVAFPAPAHAAAPSAYCLVDAVADFSKGLGATSVKGTYTTHGAADCFASPNALEPIGSGTYMSSGGFEGSCGSLAGDFVNRIRLTAATGSQTLEDSGRFVAAGTGFSFGKHSTGPFEVVEFTGDCVTTPLNNARFLAQFYIFGQ
jgi:hypothetical protein